MASDFLQHPDVIAKATAKNHIEKVENCKLIVNTSPDLPLGFGRTSTGPPDRRKGGSAGKPA
jgi:hypothetical protein